MRSLLPKPENLMHTVFQVLGSDASRQESYWPRLHQRATPQTPCVSQHQAKAQPPPRDWEDNRLLPLPPSLSLPGPGTGLPGAGRVEKTSGCHTFRELIHGGAVHKVAERISYGGLLPVPEEERGASGHSGNVSEAPGELLPLPWDSAPEPLATSLDPGLSHTRAPLLPWLEPSLLPPLLLVILHQPALASPPPGSLPSPPAEPPELLVFPYITLGRHFLCLSSHQAL